ncbi:hypothetical protein PRUPE_1G477600 [Prunus persica]|uniref:Uncharacterized protein n=1 Tax=Prunus persica TaxID=3760 RepID=A0A251REJ7_PRUPE|nr:UPF0481 protein At3g47200 isoform X2 [Prunus persica]ONI34357.1 hypothetical protein PRUPE_1G477600 [Prunus persica]
MEGSDQAPHDIENPCIPLVTSMGEELDGLSPLSSLCCIYRVPERLRRVSEKAYTPQVVSIGPLHHGKEGLKAMEDHKKRYLQDYIRRTRVSLADYVQKVKDQEAKLRSCYAETIQDVWPDMRLLENQLPFFILEELFDPDKIEVSSNNNNIERLSILNLCHNFFKNLMHIEGTDGNMEKLCASKVEHFVDFCRNLHLPLPLKPHAKGRLETLNTPSITELHRAGVKFRVGSPKNLFNIKFANGILKIPKLAISDETELTIRNLLAFEQCHCMENYINDYVVIMDRFVNTAKDVELLVKHGIVENSLGDSSEGSTLINNLADGVIVDPNDFYFAILCADLNKYCRTSWHKWQANLRQNYCNTPWATISIAAAIFLLILTFIQTVCSVISALPSKR